MRRFLDDYITILPTNSRRRVTALLEEAKVQKANLDTIVTRLTNDLTQANLVIDEFAEGSIINGSSLAIMFREASNAIRQIYQSSNDISLLLDSNEAVLSSDIAALEKELIALEKAVDNYAFLLSDAKAFNYAFLETFSDSKGKEVQTSVMPDRSGLIFTPDQQASVDLSEGTLVLGDSLSHSYPASARLVKTNVSSFVTSDTGVNNILNSNVATGWRLSASTTSPVNSTLKEFKSQHGLVSYSGALAVLEFTLDQPSPCDTIRIEPFSDTPFEIVQLIIYDDLKETSPKNVLFQVEKLEQTRNFFFPMQSVVKVKALIRQQTYKRKASQPITSEVEFWALSKEVKEESESIFFNSKRNGLIRTTMLLQAINNNKTLKRLFISSTPRTSFEKKYGGLTIQDLIKNLRTNSAFSSPWTSHGRPANLMARLIRQYLFTNNPEVNGSIPAKMTGGLYNSIINSFQTLLGSSGTQYEGAPLVPGESLQSVTLNGVKGFKYEYDFGIRSFQIGAGTKGFKGVFISKTLPASGDVGEVKIRVKEENYSIVNTNRDSSLVTSIEYSVTNKSKIVSEDDWIPIIPAPQTLVRGERFLPDSIGKGKFRFPAAINGSIFLYKNGYRVEISTDELFIYSDDRQSIIGLNIPQGEYTPRDIFTVDYVPNKDYTVAEFVDLGTTSLVSSYDEEGAGEGFSGTIGQRTISLSYNPFIDKEQVKTATYQPIVIRMQDGSIALNKTSYGTAAQPDLNSNADNYEYHHSGNNIIFNKSVDQPFRVYYQYMPSNVRFRVVLRVNDQSFISPKVDFFQIKAKIRKEFSSSNV